jgi:glutaredoxin 2
MYELDLIEDTIAKVFDLCLSTNSYVKRIDSRIDKIEKLLESNTTCYQSKTMFEKDFISIFPMKDVETIIDVETKLINNSNFERQMV